MGRNGGSRGFVREARHKDQQTYQPDSQTDTCEVGIGELSSTGAHLHKIRKWRERWSRSWKHKKLNLCESDLFFSKFELLTIRESFLRHETECWCLLESFWCHLRWWRSYHRRWRRLNPLPWSMGSSDDVRLVGMSSILVSQRRPEGKI